MNLTKDEMRLLYHFIYPNAHPKEYKMWPLVDWEDVIDIVSILNKKGYYNNYLICKAVEENNEELLHDWIIDSIKHYNKKQKELNEDRD